jgi:transketolase
MEPTLVTNQPSLREEFGRSLVNLADQYDFWVLDCDVKGGTGLHHFAEHCPERFIQCGIAEQNAAGMAAGLATEDTPVFLCLFACFALRAYEQIRLSICHNKANVKIIGSHPGLEVGPDGASAQALEDIAVFRALPNIRVFSPSDRFMVRFLSKHLLGATGKGPVYMRTGRGPARDVHNAMTAMHYAPMKVYEADLNLHSIAILATGSRTAVACEAAKHLWDEHKIPCTVFDCNCLNPFVASSVGLYNYAAVLTVEDHGAVGGLGEIVASWMAYCGTNVPVESLAVQSQMGESGEAEELWAKYSIDQEAIVTACRRFERMYVKIASDRS